MALYYLIICIDQPQAEYGECSKSKKITTHPDTCVGSGLDLQHAFNVLLIIFAHMKHIRRTHMKFLGFEEE